MLTLGQVVTTASITNAMSTNLYFHVFILECLLKHLDYDFGAICKEDHNANMRAIQDGGRVFSIYLIPEKLKIDQEKIYVITEADRSYTTALYPHEISVKSIIKCSQIALNTVCEGVFIIGFVDVIKHPHL